MHHAEHGSSSSGTRSRRLSASGQGGKGMRSRGRHSRSVISERGAKELRAPISVHTANSRRLAHDVDDPQLYWWVANPVNGAGGDVGSGGGGVNGNVAPLSQFTPSPLQASDCRGFPAIVHQTWKTANLPSSYREWQGTWIQAMPSFKVSLWTDA